MTGAIRRYCQGRADPLLPEGEADAAGLQMRALLPVSFPRPEEGGFRNRWCFVSCPMPVGTGSVLGRLAATRAATAALKNSLVAPVQLFIQNSVLPYVPLFVSRQTCLDTFARHTCIFTNVPGPPAPVILAGKPLTSMQMIFPNLISQISLLSYAGLVHCNAVVDEATVANAPALRRHFVNELRELGAALQVPFPPAIDERAKALGGMQL